MARELWPRPGGAETQPCLPAFGSSECEEMNGCVTVCDDAHALSYLRPPGAHAQPHNHCWHTFVISIRHVDLRFRCVMRRCDAPGTLACAVAQGPFASPSVPAVLSTWPVSCTICQTNRGPPSYRSTGVVECKIVSLSHCTRKTETETETHREREREREREAC